MKKLALQILNEPNQYKEVLIKFQYINHKRTKTNYIKWTEEDGLTLGQEDQTTKDYTDLKELIKQMEVIEINIK